MFQGGFICAAFDDVFGPLSYMAALRPVVTVDMNTTFIRPFTANDVSAIFTAELVSLSKSMLVMRAEARTLSGKLIATSTNTSMILSDDQLITSGKNT
jgi:acyl-coenzyme A thioesterase PaaI-like protein